MEQMGIHLEKLKNCIKVSPQKYIPYNIKVEGDWSGVSYWYEAVAFSPGADIFINNLNRDSLQGDSRCAEIFKHFGVVTEYLADGIRIYNIGTVPPRFDFDFLENPDLVQTMAVTCVIMGIPFSFSDTQSLRIKETDRIVALQNELKKFGANLNYQEGGILEWNGILKDIGENKISVATYQDHRMALAFAPIAILGKEIRIDNPGVVAKSYPDFWNDLKKMDFEVR
jgi:3-phosphoshikimate 1-carboxyvinyltransferase